MDIFQELEVFQDLLQAQLQGSPEDPSLWTIATAPGARKNSSQRYQLRVGFYFSDQLQQVAGEPKCIQLVLCHLSPSQPVRSQVQPHEAIEAATIYGQAMAMASTKSNTKFHTIKAPGA